MSPVPTSTAQESQTNAASGTSSVPSESTQRPEGGVQDLSNEALDFAAKMFDLARQGDSTLITYLQAGLPPNLTNNRGDTLLMLASYHGHASLVSEILSLSPQDVRIPREHGADPNQLNGKGQSIVAGAVFKGYDEVVNILIQHGADPLAGQPSAEDTAKMFGRWEDSDDKKGFKALFENASGRGKGAREAPEAVPDREEQQRVPGQETSA